MCASFFHDLWIQVGAIYGEPEGPNHPQFRRHNEELLHQVASHICHLAVGPRAVMGDWNVEVDSLPAFQILRNAGFRDVQELAEMRFGRSIQCTSKGRTRRDYCFLSPELQRLLTGVQVINDLWPDHALLQGQFWSTKARRARQIWIKPQPLRWPTDFHVPDDVWTGSDLPCDQRYEHLWHVIEESAAQHTYVASVARGRGKASFLKQVFDKPSQPLRPSRKGELVPGLDGISKQHALWFRQARRIQAFCRHVGKTDGVVDTDYAHQVWQAVYRAKGFEPTFGERWKNLDHRAPMAPLHLPCSPPNRITAAAIMDTMTMAIRRLEGQLKKQSRQYAKLRRDNHPMVVFQDLKEGGSPAVDTLVFTRKSSVVEVNLDEQALILSDVVPWDTSLPIMCNGHKLEVFFADHDTIWVSDASPFVKGMTVAQPVFTGEPTALFQAFADTWKERWSRHASTRVPVGCGLGIC